MAAAASDDPPATAAPPGGADRAAVMAGITGPQLVDAVLRRPNVGMAITDEFGEFLEVNEALCTFLGCRSDELLGRTFRDITAPEDVERSAEELRRLAAGTSTHFCLEKRFVTPSGDRTWGRLTATAVRDDAGRLARVIAEVEDLSPHRALQDALSRQESHDELTGLGNRRVFYERLRAALAHPRPSARRLAVLIVNVDRFRQINAGIGQAAADRILCEVARRLTAVTRGQDSVARMGGDEFAILAVGCATPEEAVALAVLVRRSVGEPYWSDGNAVFVSVRIGVVTAPADGTEAELLIARATVAGQEAKALSGGWAMHVEGSDEAGAGALRFVGDLRAAIDNGELTVAFQPVVDGQGRVHYLEVLARWFHPERGAVPPDQFIVLAEQNGLIKALTTRVLGLAAHQAVRWHAAGMPVSVGVNLSGKLLSDPGLVAHVSQIVASAGLPAKFLTLEITETALAEGSNQVIWDALDALRATGMRVAIDDFGTGYCSLAYLKRLPVDEIKIDRSFIVDLDSDVRTERIVRSVIALAHSLHLPVIAEGVEDEAVATSLLRLGADYLQGYHIARPADARITAEWLQQRSPTSGGAAGPAESRVLDVLFVHDLAGGAGDVYMRLAERHHRIVEVPSGSAALEHLARAMPDVIVLDHLMPGLTGVETAPRLRAEGYVGPILLFSDFPPEALSEIRFPIDVWPVSKTDETTLLRLIDGYAATHPRL